MKCTRQKCTTTADNTTHKSVVAPAAPFSLLHIFTEGSMRKIKPMKEKISMKHRNRLKDKMCCPLWASCERQPRHEESKGTAW